MGKLNTLYLYQEADMEMDKLEASLKTTPTYKRYQKIRSYIAEQRKVLQRMDSAIEGRKKQISVTSQRCDLLQQRFEEGTEKFEVADKTKIAEVERFRKYFEQLYARISQERREFTELVTALEKEDQKLNDMRIKLARTRKEYDELTVKIEQERELRKPEFDVLFAAVEKTGAGIDSTLLEAYKDAKRSHAMPIAKVASNRCCGCNMELPAVILRRLKEDEDIVQCESCGRMLHLE